MQLFQKQNPCSHVTKQETEACLCAPLQEARMHLLLLLLLCVKNAALWLDRRITQIPDQEEITKMKSFWNARASRLGPSSFRHKEHHFLLLVQMETRVPSLCRHRGVSSHLHVSKHDAHPRNRWRARTENRSRLYLVFNIFCCGLFSFRPSSTAESIHRYEGMPSDGGWRIQGSASPVSWMTRLPLVSDWTSSRPVCMPVVLGLNLIGSFR